MERIGEWLDRMLGPEPERDEAVRARSKESVEREMAEELGSRGWYGAGVGDRLARLDLILGPPPVSEERILKEWKERPGYFEERFEARWKNQCMRCKRHPIALHPTGFCVYCRMDAGLE